MQVPANEVGLRQYSVDAIGSAVPGTGEQARRKLICMRQESRPGCAERSWRIAVSSLHHVFVLFAARGSATWLPFWRYAKYDIEKQWQRNLTIRPPSYMRWTVSALGLGENEAETRHREPNRATPDLAATAGADGESAQKLDQVSARLSPETWRLDPRAVCGLAVSKVDRAGRAIHAGIASVGIVG
ncbi:hypothetical protein V8C35DRAFT_198643 [Trichoderma chlorosporum]